MNRSKTPKTTVAGLRPSIWLRHLGDRNTSTRHFGWRTRSIPSAELVLNEYDIECVGDDFCGAAAGALTLVRDLLGARRAAARRWVCKATSRANIRSTNDGLTSFVSEMKSLGLSVHVTELDVIDEELPPQVSLRDAIVAARAHDFLAAVFAAARPEIDRHLGNYRPLYVGADVVQTPGRVCLIDRCRLTNYQPKPLWSVIDYFCQKTA